MEKIVVLSGAGMSAESGIKTFRDHDGLWENHDVTEVASPQGWQKNPELVLEFYNQRRRQLMEVTPNPGHYALVKLEAKYQVQVITQNVDDLHERAGSTSVMHLHGELRKVRSVSHPHLIYDWPHDLKLGDLCPQSGTQLRPHIVWFGEAVPMIETALNEVLTADHILIIGTSMSVYPAAGLVGFAAQHAGITYIDPHPSLNYELQQSHNLQVIAQPAGLGVTRWVDQRLEQA